jgi:hypothetical protein
MKKHNDVTMSGFIRRRSTAVSKGPAAAGSNAHEIFNPLRLTLRAQPRSTI